MVDIREAIEAKKKEGYSAEEILEILTDALLNAKPKKMSENDFEQEITKVMIQLGIPLHFKGYSYIRSAIQMAIKKPLVSYSITKEVYPEVAKIYKTTSSKVERAIRHAIEVTWERGDINVLNNYFGYTVQNSKGRPTNSEFIAMIADKIRLKYKLS